MLLTGHLKGLHGQHLPVAGRSGATLHLTNAACGSSSRDAGDTAKSVEAAHVVQSPQRGLYATRPVAEPSSSKTADVRGYGLRQLRLKAETRVSSHQRRWHSGAPGLRCLGATEPLRRSMPVTAHEAPALSPHGPLDPHGLLHALTSSVVLCALTPWSSTRSPRLWSSARSPRGPVRAHSVCGPLHAHPVVLHALTPSVFLFARLACAHLFWAYLLHVCTFIAFRIY